MVCVFPIGLNQPVILQAGRCFHSSTEHLVACMSVSREESQLQGTTSPWQEDATEQGVEQSRFCKTYQTAIKVLHSLYYDAVLARPKHPWLNFNAPLTSQHLNSP